MTIMTSPIPDFPCCLCNDSMAAPGDYIPIRYGDDVPSFWSITAFQPGKTLVAMEEATGVNGNKIWQVKHVVHGKFIQSLKGNQVQARYLVHGKLHRLDGPALITRQGDKEWWQYGQRHREYNQPAVHRSSGHQEWWLRGRLHRRQGPTIIDSYGNQSWHQHGRLHSMTHPVKVLRFDGFKFHETSKKVWMLGDLECRLDGPAITASRYQCWMQFGKEHRSGSHKSTSRTFHTNGTVTKNWRVAGRLHRIEGPAVSTKYSNQDDEYWLFGKKVSKQVFEDAHQPIEHGTSTPWQRFSKVEYEGNVEYLLNGQRHRDDQYLPAVFWINGHREWWRNGRLHRDHDEPAVIYKDGTQEWWKNGKRHRLQGPAVIGPNGLRMWFKRGIFQRCECDDIEAVKPPAGWPPCPYECDSQPQAQAIKWWQRWLCCRRSR